MNSNPDTKTYTFNFFPEQNAFSLSPAPPHHEYDDYLVHGDRKTFKWELQDNDVLVFNWPVGAENVHVDFTPYFHSERFLPFLIYVGGKFIKPIDGENGVRAGVFTMTTPGQKIKITESDESKAGKLLSMWSFDFCCSISGLHYRIDPSVKLGTGTNRPK